MKKLSPYEQLFYDDFESGLTWAGISVKRKVPFSEVMEIRYEIMKKGYDVKERSRTKQEQPTATAPAAEIREEGKHMEKRTCKRLTEEEAAALVEYRETHSKAETAEKFGVSYATVYNICKRAEGQAAPAPNDAPTLTAEIPGVVRDAIIARMYQIDENIDLVQRKLLRTTGKSGKAFRHGWHSSPMKGVKANEKRCEPSGALSGEA